MFISKKILIGIISMLVIAVIAAGLFVTFSPVRISFAQAPTPTAQPGQGASTSRGQAGYADFFLSAFASHLGIGVDRVKEAYQQAISDTLDQAVKDGKLTHDQADKLKNNLTNRLDQGMLPGILGWYRFGPFERFGPDRGVLIGRKGAFELSSFANALSMTQADLASELRSGKTIADVAKEKNIDLTQVKTSVLSDLKSKLDQVVQNDKLTQAQADEIYNQLSTNFDTFVNRTWPTGPFWRMK